MLLVSATWKPAIAAVVGGAGVEFEPRIFLGLNAPQVRIVSDSKNYLSDGYNGLVAGGGFAVFPVKTFSLEIDGLYSARVFGFGSTKGYFNCIQIPLTASVHIGKFALGGGMYGALWRSSGKIEKSGSTSNVSVDMIGNESREYGTLAIASFETALGKTPMRLEFRAYQSLGDMAKSPELKGSLTEYQMMVSFDFGLSELERIRNKLYGRN